MSWFYTVFDCFYETGKKYLLPDFLTQGKTKLLYTATFILWKFFVLIWQNFHGTVCDIDQVYHPFDSAPASYHVTAQWPERFLFIITGFYVPPESIKEQRNIFHPCTAGTVQGCFFLPGTENLQLFRKNRTEKKSLFFTSRFRGSDICQYLPAAKQICNDRADGDKITVNLFIRKNKICFDGELFPMSCRIMSAASSSFDFCFVHIR